MPNLVRYRGNNSGRLHSGNIWYDCPIASLQNGEIEGHYWFDDFKSSEVFTEADDVVEEEPYPYMTAASDGVTLGKLADSDHGIITSGAMDADEDGFVLVYGNAAGWMRFTSADRAWFECRIKQESVANSNPVFFAGAIEITVPPTSVITLVDTSGVLDVSEDFIGFRSLAADGDAVEPIYQEGGQTLAHVGTGTTNAQGSGNDIAIAADTFKKFGFRWDGQKISYYANGVRQAYYKPTSADSFPDVNHMAMIWAAKCTAASEVDFAMDWWAGAAYTVS